MGRQIVRVTSRNNCERWSRLWDPDNVIVTDVLENYYQATKRQPIKLKSTEEDNKIGVGIVDESRSATKSPLREEEPSSMFKAREQDTKRWSFDVFLSFRGLDVRYTFASILINNFRRNGINVFIDEHELKRGESISPSLSKAIQDSEIHIVVLSEHYASSAWCLDELVHIMECRESDSGHIVYPVFYNTEPADLRRQKGSVGEFFDKHKSRYPENKVQKWKEALTEIANLSGLVRANYRDEADFIIEVSKDIMKILSVSYKHLPKYAIGIRSRVHRMKELMCLGSEDAQYIGICGMGGIGKTTLAKAAFNEFSYLFEGTSFLENFGQYCKKPEGKVCLQRQLISDILGGGNDIVFRNMDHVVKHRFRNKRVLVIIDDVEDVMQLDSIDLSCFGPGSRIIITSRDVRPLKQLEVENIYSPKELNCEESLELVSWHAFRSSELPEEFRQPSEKLVEYCRGLPLALEVLSTFLFKRSISEWKSTLESLKRIPDGNIHAKLRISYDALNTAQKNIFLDISCFFIGMDKDYVGCIFDGCKLDPGIGLSVLKERFLITVEGNRLMMHGLLREMGRQIVREKYPDNYEKWSRLWDPEHVLDVLTNHYGTDKTIGLSLKAEATGVQNLEVRAFSNLKKLRLLELSHVSLNGSYENFPKGIRWLFWAAFPLDSVPVNLHLRSLVVMDMQYSNLKRFWDDQELQTQFGLKELKYLDLSHSILLAETPDFSYLPNLEKLLLLNCKSLVMVHKSIGTLDKLVLVNLNGCTELGDLPLELYTLKSLETLILSGCSKLERLDDALGELESLTTLKADFTALRRIPSSSNQLKKLRELSLDGCINLWKDRDHRHSNGSPQDALSKSLSLNGLNCLKTLRLGSCNLSDELVPEDLGSLSCLEELDLQGNNFRNLQTDFAGLSSLQKLRLDGCSELQFMFSLPKSLRIFYARNCVMLEKTPDLSECSTLRSLHLTNCSNLVETPGLDTLEMVGVIRMEMCNRMPHTYRETIMQGWAVSANGGIFIPGSSVPNWVTFKNETGSISFTVPETLNPALVGFTLWTSYVSQQDDEMSEYSPKITVRNQTKGDVWSHNPATDHIRMYSTEHVWQGHFSNEMYLETGDQVEVCVDLGDQVTILETGLTLSYREEDTDTSYSNSSAHVNTGLTLAYREEGTESSDSDASDIGHDSK